MKGVIESNQIKLPKTSMFRAETHSRFEYTKLTWEFEIPEKLEEYSNSFITKTRNRMTLK